MPHLGLPNAFSYVVGIECPVVSPRGARNNFFFYIQVFQSQPTGNLGHAGTVQNSNTRTCLVLKRWRWREVVRCKVLATGYPRSNTRRF